MLYRKLAPARVRLPLRTLQVVLSDASAQHLQMHLQVSDDSGRLTLQHTGVCEYVVYADEPRVHLRALRLTNAAAIANAAEI